MLWGRHDKLSYLTLPPPRVVRLPGPGGGEGPEARDGVTDSREDEVKTEIYCQLLFDTTNTLCDILK